MKSTPRLVTVSYSPWSEKARWALDHHRIAYREVESTPLLGLLRLRLAARKPRGRITLPLLFVDGRVLHDSYDIARYADRIGRRQPLFPSQEVQAIAQWHALAEEATQAGRALATRRTAADPEALDQSLPDVIPRLVRRPFARVGVRYLERKYRLAETDDDTGRQTIRATLTKTRRALDNGDYILGHFTYADIALAVALQLISPVADTYIRLGRHARRGMTDAQLATEFADLVAWRDRLYERHRH